MWHLLRVRSASKDYRIIMSVVNERLPHYGPEIRMMLGRIAFRKARA